MKYWDTSALVPLYVSEASSHQMRDLFRQDPDVLTWWGSRVECLSVLMRRNRNNEFSPEELDATEIRLHRLRLGWKEVSPSREVRLRAEECLTRHFLRGADALQLSAAMVARSRAEFELPFVCQDLRLRTAAAAEGFTVLP